MCQTAQISKNIRSISVRSFERNLEASSGMEVSALKLARINKSMDSLYDLLYSEFNDISSDDYKVIGPQLAFLLQTVKNLCLFYKTSSPSKAVKCEIDNLWNNYSALYELKGDLERFRLNKNPNPRLNNALKVASSYIGCL